MSRSPYPSILVLLRLLCRSVAYPAHRRLASRGREAPRTCIETQIAPTWAFVSFLESSINLESTLPGAIRAAMKARGARILRFRTTLRRPDAQSDVRCEAATRRANNPPISL